MRTENRRQRIHQVLSRRQLNLAIVMENIHDPHNIAAIMRTADAVGVLDVNLIYNYEEFPDFTKLGAQSSAGTRKWLRTPQFRRPEECYADLRARGMAVYASHLDRDSIDLYDLDLSRPTALVFGNEHRGVSDDCAELADGTFVIPMMGMVQSLNVSVAAAVTLYEALRQRLRAGMYDTRSLSDDEYEALMAEWLSL